MNRFSQKVREKRGSAELITAILVLILAIMCTVLIVSVSALGPKATAANVAAHEIANKVAEDGQYGSTEQSYISSYLCNTGLSATVTCDKSGTIQKGNFFTITLETSSVIGIGNVGQVTIPITAHVTQTSKVYTAGD